MVFIRSLNYCRAQGRGCRWVMLQEFPQKDFGPNELVYQLGDAAGSGFILMSGSVEIFKEGTSLMQTIRPGRMFGVVDIIADRARVNSARCTRKSKLIIVPHDFILKSVADTDPFLQAIMCFSTQRISQLYPDLW